MANETLKEEIAKAREALDFLEQIANHDTDFGLGFSANPFNVFMWDRREEQFKTLLKILGSFKKDTTSDLFYVSKKLKNVTIDFCVPRDMVCKRIEEKQIVPAKPERVLPAEPEHEKTVVRWECPESLLSPASTEANHAGTDTEDR